MLNNPRLQHAVVGCQRYSRDSGLSLAPGLQNRRVGAVETMADRIRSLRESKNFTQEELAKACGVTASAVSQWETAVTANIKLEPFLTLCRVLGTDPYYLAFGPSRVPSKDSQKKGA